MDTETAITYLIPHVPSKDYANEPLANLFHQSRSTHPNTIMLHYNAKHVPRVGEGVMLYGRIYVVLTVLHVPTDNEFYVGVREE